MIKRGDELFGGLGTHWLTRAVTSGFLGTILATLALAVAYGTALLLGSPNPEAPIVLRWTWALAHNVVTQDVQNNLPLAVLLHFLAGIGWAFAYAILAEPRLQGPGWRRGLLFSLVPWALSLAVFLPVVGGGLLGLALGAGPLPILGNLVLHLVYGATLGQLYAPESDRPLGERMSAASLEEFSALAHSRHTMAVGIVLGLVLGGLAGLLFDIVFAPGFGSLLSLLIGAIMGSAVGMLVGSFWGLSPQQS